MSLSTALRIWKCFRTPWFTPKSLGSALSVERRGKEGVWVTHIWCLVKSVPGTLEEPAPLHLLPPHSHNWVSQDLRDQESMEAIKVSGVLKDASYKQELLPSRVAPSPAAAQGGEAESPDHSRASSVLWPQVSPTPLPLGLSAGMADLWSRLPVCGQGCRGGSRVEGARAGSFCATWSCTVGTRPPHTALFPVLLYTTVS